MRVYISGKITGLDLAEARKQFTEAEGIIRQRLGEEVEVINPMKEVPYVEGKTWEEYMKDDIKLLMECNMIYMIEGWKTSKGANIEFNLAVSLGYLVLTQ